MTNLVLCIYSLYHVLNLFHTEKILSTVLPFLIERRYLTSINLCQSFFVEEGKGVVTREAKFYCLNLNKKLFLSKESGLKSIFVSLWLLGCPVPSNNVTRASVRFNAMSAATLHSTLSMFRHVNYVLWHGIQSYWPLNKDAYHIHDNRRYQDSASPSHNRHQRGLLLHYNIYRNHLCYQLILFIVVVQMLVKLPGKQNHLIAHYIELRLRH